MKKKNKIFVVLLLMLVLLTGCTQNLKDGKKVVQNPETGQSLTENVLCKPHEKIYDKYKDKINYDKLPECKDFKINSGGYEGLWSSIFVKPLAWLILKIGSAVRSYGLGLIIASLLIRLVAFPITKKTAMQSEMMKNAKPDLDRLEKKYKDKTDQDSIMKKNQEMMLIYKKYNINPVSGCLYALLQLPLFIAFLEAINRVPAIFEEKFLLFQLGTTPSVALQKGQFIYLILTLIVGITTYFSFKLNTTSQPDNKQANTTNKVMVIMIIVMSFFMTSALNIYWFTTNIFTVVQNLLVKRSSNKYGKI